MQHKEFEQPMIRVLSLIEPPLG
uniref:Uncharacterized protein n=1 Tax=Tetranychus urticae TaxID=32264 RepID=T1L076_TETUR